MHCLLLYEFLGNSEAVLQQGVDGVKKCTDGQPKDGVSNAVKPRRDPRTDILRDKVQPQILDEKKRQEQEYFRKAETKTYEKMQPKQNKTHRFTENEASHDRLSAVPTLSKRKSTKPKKIISHSQQNSEVVSSQQVILTNVQSQSSMTQALIHILTS